MIDINNFDWGESSDWYKHFIGDEIFIQRIYEKFFTVEENDVVFDVGASLGIFTYSILDKNPKHVFCFEPGLEQFRTLVNNTRMGNVTCINKGISSTNGEAEFVDVYGVVDNKKHYSITFKDIIETYGIKQIDFLKTDCEGGEYDIFTIDNLFWIKNNVKKIAGEFHLGVGVKENFIEKFRVFRDVYLRVFPNFQVHSLDGVDIKWDLWNEHFFEYYKQVLIFIDNQ
jgi:FkbM family methyltransferase